MSWMDLVSLLFETVDSYPHVMRWEPGRSFGNSSRSHMCGLSGHLNDLKACAPMPERVTTLVMSADEETLRGNTSKALACPKATKQFSAFEDSGS